MSRADQAPHDPASAYDPPRAGLSRRGRRVVAGSAAGVLVVGGVIAGLGTVGDGGVLARLTGSPVRASVSTDAGVVGGVALPAAATAEAETPEGTIVDPAVGGGNPEGVSTAGSNGEVRLDVGSLVPSTATSVLFVPYSVTDSWAAVSRLVNSRTELATIDLAESPVADRVAVVGVASVPSDGPRFSYDGGDSTNAISPTTEFAYVATSDATAAEELRAWLVTSDAYGGLSVETRGSLVVIAPSWIRPGSALEGDRLGGVEAFSTAVADLDSPSLLYVDVAADLASKSSGADEVVRGPFEEYASKAIGATDSYWIASVGDSAYEWSGYYLGDPVGSADEDEASLVPSRLLSAYFPSPDPDAAVSEIGSAEIPPEVMATVRAMGAVTGTRTEDGLEVVLDESAIDGAFADLAASSNISTWRVVMSDGDLSVTLTPAPEVWSSAAVVTTG